MTDILAHDIDGRPLRAGDRVVLLKAAAEPNYVGKVVTIIGPPSLNDEFDIDIPFPGYGAEWYGCTGSIVRRIDADHTPADHGFTELVENLKTGSLEPLEIE